MPTLVEHSNQELRKALSQISRTPQDEISQLGTLRLTHHHSIALVPWTGRLSFNCVQYAFDLIDLPDAVRRKIGCLNNQGPGQGPAPRIHPLDTPFVNFLIKEGDLLELDRAESGSVIVYLDDNRRVRHCGKILGELVRSKWGHRGHLLQHRIEEVPIDWGAPKFFASISPDKSVPRLLSFMEEIRHADTLRQRKRLLESLNAAGYSKEV